MKRSLLALFVVLSFSFQSKSITLQDARSLLMKCRTGQSSAAYFYAELEKSEWSNKALLIGYKGIAKAMMAEDAFNPYTKLTLFKEGTTFIEKAILADSTNIELRLLRYMVQHEAPSFLSYRQHIREDERMILIYNSSSNSDRELKQLIATFSHFCNCLPEKKSKTTH